MLYESLNDPAVEPKSIVELSNDQLELASYSLMENGMVVTTKSGLKAFQFYRDFAMRKQKPNDKDFKVKTIVVNNARKNYVVS